MSRSNKLPSKIIGVCQLCKEERRLVKSHIIPKFMYDGMFNVMKKLAMTDFITGRQSFIPDGIYDTAVLCRECDSGIIGKYESYAGPVLYKGIVHEKNSLVYTRRRGHDGMPSLLVTGIDYVNFKLFLLSLLWRASITTQKFFSEVSLGRHENTIRDMLWSADPGDEDDYPSCIFVTEKHPKIPDKVICPPKRLKEEGHTNYIFMINGAYYLFDISKHLRDRMFNIGKIRKDNTMDIPVLPPLLAAAYYSTYMGGQKQNRN